MLKNKRYALTFTSDSVILMNLECGMSEQATLTDNAQSMIEHIAVLAQKGLLDMDDFKGAAEER